MFEPKIPSNEEINEFLKRLGAPKSYQLSPSNSLRVAKDLDFTTLYLIIDWIGCKYNRYIWASVDVEFDPPAISSNGCSNQIVRAVWKPMITTITNSCGSSIDAEHYTDGLINVDDHSSITLRVNGYPRNREDALKVAVAKFCEIELRKKNAKSQVKEMTIDERAAELAEEVIDDVNDWSGKHCKDTICEALKTQREITAKKAIEIIRESMTAYGHLDTLDRDRDSWLEILYSSLTTDTSISEVQTV